MNGTLYKRRIFLKKLGKQLVKNNAARRAVKSAIFSSPSPAGTNTSSIAGKKRCRCVLCPRSKDVNITCNNYDCINNKLYSKVGLQLQQKTVATVAATIAAKSCCNCCSNRCCNSCCKYYNSCCMYSNNLRANWS